MLGGLYGNQGNLEAALEQFEVAMEIKPGRAFVAYNGAAFFRATLPVDGEYAELEIAEELARKSHARLPVSSTLGVVLYRRAKWNEAIQYLEQSERLSRGLPEHAGYHAKTTIWLCLAMANEKAGNAEEAKKWHEKALDWRENNQPDPQQQRYFDEAQRVFEPDPEGDT